MIWLIILGITIALIVCGLLIWLIVVVYKEKEQPNDDTIFKNFIPQYSEGYSYGTILEIIRGDVRTGIKFLPRDLDYVKIFKKKERVNIEPKLVWFENSKLITFPKGTLSSHRHEIWGLPPKPEDLNQEIKSTKYGEALMSLIEDANAKKEETDILRKRLQTQTKILEKTEGLELVEDFMNKAKEINKDIIKQVHGSSHKQSPIGMPPNL